MKEKNKMTTIDSNVTHNELVTYDAAIKEWIKKNFNIEEQTDVKIKILNGDVVILYEE